MDSSKAFIKHNMYLFVSWNDRTECALHSNMATTMSTIHFTSHSIGVEWNRPFWEAKSSMGIVLVCQMSAHSCANAMSSAEHRRECSNYKINYRRITMIDSKCIAFFISFLIRSVYVHRISSAVVGKTWDGDNNWLTTLLANKHDRLVVVSCSMCNGRRASFGQQHINCASDTAKL